MSNENNAPPSRRASFSPGQTLSDIFSGAARSSGSSSSSYGSNAAAASGTAPYPSPIATAAANAHRRRMSITTLGLSGTSPTQTSPFGAGMGRRASVSSNNSTAIDESAIDDGDAPMTTPVSPFARRMSFGARALRDVRAGIGGNSANGRAPLNHSSSPTFHSRGPSSHASILPTNPTSTPRMNYSDNSSTRHSGEGFNWSDSLRSRAERTSMSAVNANAAAPISSSPPPPPSAMSQRAAATAAPAPPPPARAAKVYTQPDHIQERILKGDFYMD
ncbi:MAG: hypothetical protein M1829_000692 [Trizodia sp. TS-e1964]|nr:MAG: hypothetical protein M1829_000692 [Trizodia sp. TS-e1964]